MKNFNHMYKDCRLCKRECGVDRLKGELGFCRSGALARVARASLHMWEEPVISGERGSGTIFLSGCSLGCIYCQNRAISRSSVGREMNKTELADLMFRLEERGCHNINFVTPTHFAPSIAMAIEEAKIRGLKLPIVYNTGSMESVETLYMLDGLVDIYLPDLKYHRRQTAEKLSGFRDYPEAAHHAIAEMARQCPYAKLENGIMTQGVIVRYLLLPGHLAECKLALKYIFDMYRNSLYYSLMSQYTPMEGMPSPLNRTVTREEYSELVRYACDIGIVHGFTQEGSAAKESFIPDFLCEKGEDKNLVSLDL